MQAVNENTLKIFQRKSIETLIGIFVGYAAYYIVRNNFIYSTSFLAQDLDLSKTEIGLLTGAMLITYGLSKGVMSILADKSNPKYFMATGLAFCIVINIIMGFTSSFYVFVLLVILLGLFQGMGVGPSVITIGYWFPRTRRGRASTVWNASQNLGGGIVAPIIGCALGIMGQEHWRLASYIVPAAISGICLLMILWLVKQRPAEEGLPPVEEVYDEESVNDKVVKKGKVNPEKMTSLQIFYQYVIKNLDSWYLVFIGIFIYMVRFGMITWIPLYLLTVKDFSRAEMNLSFLLFEWAAIPSTLIAGYLADKFFKGRVMLLPFICLLIVLGCIIGYMEATDSFWITVFATVTGCLIYIPQSMVPVQAMEVIPSFALGSAVGLRGFMSYIVGTSLGTTLFGFMVDNFGWSSGFYTIIAGAALCMIFCYLSHRRVQKIYSK